jgi:hypothetical protein
MGISSARLGEGIEIPRVATDLNRVLNFICASILSIEALPERRSRAVGQWAVTVPGSACAAGGVREVTEVLRDSHLA